ncbi:MFS transporter [Escherichia coli]
MGLIPDMGIWLVVMAFAVYAFFSGGPGNLQWLYPNELFPTDIRASAVGVIMSLSRIGTIVRPGHYQSLSIITVSVTRC